LSIYYYDGRETQGLSSQGKTSRGRRLHDGRGAGAEIRCPRKADRIRLVRVLRADPWATAMVWLRGRAAVAWLATRVAGRRSDQIR